MSSRSLFFVPSLLRSFSTFSIRKTAKNHEKKPPWLKGLTQNVHGAQWGTAVGMIGLIAERNNEEGWKDEHMPYVHVHILKTQLVPRNPKFQSTQQLRT